MTGSIQVRQVRNTPDVAGRSDKTVNFVLPGPMYPAGSNAEAHSAASMAHFEDSSSYDPEVQPFWCSTTQFDGFTDYSSKANVKVGTATAFRAARQNVVQARVDLTDVTTTAKLTDNYCGGDSAPSPTTRYQPLVSADYSRRGLLGAGSGPQAVESVSPGLLTFRKSGGAWNSSGSVTRGFNDPGHDFLFGSNGTITVSWNLTSSFITSSCLAPSAKTMRNKSLKSARKTLRSYGFKSGRIDRYKVSQYRKARGVKRGRVIDIGYFPFNPRTQKCGTKVSISIRK